MLHYLLRSRSLPRRIPKSQIQSKMTTVLPADLTKPDPLTSSKKEEAVTTPNQQTLRLVDVAINLGDPVFRGVYHGKQVHDDDLEDVLKRAVDVGCVKMLVTGSDLENSRRAVKMAEERRGLCYATIGIHPCSATNFEDYPGGPSALLQELESLARSSQNSKPPTVSAFGEIGLDYDRLFLCPKDKQLKYFEAQLDLAVKLQLPLFLHSRAASADFERLLRDRLDQLPRRGLVHSFTGSIEEMHRLVAMSFDIGVNGCSMKTEENVQVVKAIPLERLQIETDGPWCEMRPSHASAKYVSAAPLLVKSMKKEKWERGLMVKGRNEPAAIVQVAYAVAAIKDLPVEDVCMAASSNSTNMFGLDGALSGKGLDAYKIA